MISSFSACFRTRRRGGPALGAVLLTLLAAGLPVSGQAQEELTVWELEGLYRSAVAGHEQALEAAEVLDSRFRRASQEVADADAAGDEEAKNRAFAETLRLGPQLRQALKRVEERAAELREVRRRLLDATAAHLQDLLTQAQEAPDSMARRAVLTLVLDTRNRITELRNLEDPQVTLEPEPHLNAEPRDGPVELRNKASTLEASASRYQQQYALYQTELEGLRRDQRLLRRSEDFLADFARFDDPTVPVGPPTTRVVPGQEQVPPLPGADTAQVVGRPLTLEERIQALELLQEEITRRIENALARAAELRRQAGGEWA